MKTFKDYYKKNLDTIKKCAKRDKITVEQFLDKMLEKTLKEYKAWQKKNYNRKQCHSFWSRECVNKGIECHRCSEYYSTADFDKNN